MENLKLALSGAWKVLATALILGAGVPTMFALSIRALAIGGSTKDDQPARPIGKILAALCLLIVVAAIVLGLTFIVASGFGKKLSFHEIYPTLIDK